MNPEFVPFEKIDKNKWNGTVHYAPNGNVYGYYWYLRSVVKEWDAWIEGDYQSVMPIPRKNWSNFELDLIPSCGPYTVNALTESRIGTFYSKWKSSAGCFSYPFNDQITMLLQKIDGSKLKSTSLHHIHLNDSYDELINNYTTETRSEIDHFNSDDFSFAAIEKPEIFLAQEKLKDHEKNILYRLLYNAIQRGIGSCYKVINLKKNTSAFAFFISDINKTYTTYTGSQNDREAEILLFDAFLKNNSGKPHILYSSVANQNIFKKFGGIKSDVLKNERVPITLFQKFKETISTSYFSGS